MKHSLGYLLILSVAGFLKITPAFATNPLIMDQFTADPTARIFDGKIYIYPSHDIKAPPEYKGKPDWFVMEDTQTDGDAVDVDWISFR